MAPPISLSKLECCQFLIVFVYRKCLLNLSEYINQFKNSKDFSKQSMTTIYLTEKLNNMIHFVIYRAELDDLINTPNNDSDSTDVSLPAKAKQECKSMSYLNLRLSISSYLM